MADRQDRGATARQQLTYTIERRDRHWEVRDPAGELVCLTVYKCGAREVVRRISLLEASGHGPTVARV
jgi:hypothetical protein